jgi:mannose-6-phosphate isomerase-like protein (cupin superfamily)
LQYFRWQTHGFRIDAVPPEWVSSRCDSIWSSTPELEDSMRAFVVILAWTIAAGAIFAQQPAPPTKTYASAADVAALLAKAKAEHKDGQPTVVEHILTLAPYGANMEYRSSVGPAAVHEKDAEMFYVIDGSATLTTGGKLANEKRTNAENLTGTGIEGGKSQAVAKGDFVIVPENTPHQFSAIDGTIVLMSIHVPRSGGANP